MRSVFGWIFGAILMVAGFPLKAGLDEIRLFSANEGTYLITRQAGSDRLRMSVPDSASMPVVSVDVSGEGVKTYIALGGGYQHRIQTAGDRVTYGMRDPGTWMTGPFSIDPD